MSDINRQELVDFLIEAKRHGWMSGKTPETKQGYRCFEYRRGVWQYRDCSRGNMRSFGGEEVVLFKRKPAWHLAYQGGMTPIGIENRLTEETKKNLRFFLHNMDSNMPTRGPRHDEKDEFMYANLPRGDLNSFTGFELIHHATVGASPIYALNYLGGTY